MKRAGKIIKNKGSLIYNISFQGNRLRKWIHSGRRVGTPRMNWAAETVREIWDHIRKDHPQDRWVAFDEENDDIIENIHEAARR